MALTSCKECGKQISSKTKKCPHCGEPQSKKNPLVIALLLVMFIGFLVASMSKTPPPAEHNQAASVVEETPLAPAVKQKEAPPVQVKETPPVKKHIMTPEEVAQYERDSREKYELNARNTAYSACQIYIRKHAHDEDSVEFDISRWMAVRDGDKFKVVLKFSARNAFNAVRKYTAGCEVEEGTWTVAGIYDLNQ